MRILGGMQQSEMEPQMHTDTHGWYVLGDALELWLPAMDSLS